MKKHDRTKIWVFIVIRFSVIIAGAIAIIDRNWTYLGMSILTLIVMLLPSIIEKQFRLDIPDEFEIVLILFVFAAVFLGELHQFYDKFWWWDKVLHSFSGLILGNIGYLIVSYLNSSTKMNITLSPIFVAVFSFCFAIAMGAVWEIFEYSMDKLFGLFMQRGSLDDTMIDLILDTMGALIFSILGYFQKKGKINIISKYLVKFKRL
ncbi:MAG: hypothetical protein AB7G87_13955 [Clostridia bacterium]